MYLLRKCALGNFHQTNQSIHARAQRHTTYSTPHFVSYLVERSLREQQTSIVNFSSSSPSRSPPESFSLHVQSISQLNLTTVQSDIRVLFRGETAEKMVLGLVKLK